MPCYLVEVGRKNHPDSPWIYAVLADTLARVEHVMAERLEYSSHKGPILKVTRVADNVVVDVKVNGIVVGELVRGSDDFPPVQPS